ncbi:hypothetical protein GDO81_021677 [Engystomops pustulosus]|uniref:RING-type E3 ubiquitin transferase n=1 Tax=Engystomops pustulosus TaxID=76066 RepID=A0AAV6Z953_ENGPU|nr:hypothetical protein GDO81_021677 [Engystomops pustulosus]
MQWLVRVSEYGGTGVMLDEGDVGKFITLSKDPITQCSFKTYFVVTGIRVQNLLLILAHCFQNRYPAELDLPLNEKPWYTIRDGLERLKEEAMRSALSVLGMEDDFLNYPLTASIRNSHTSSI